MNNGVFRKLSKKMLLHAALLPICVIDAGACEPSSFRMAIDIGHSVESPGAISARGVTERDFNVALGAQVAAKLNDAGFTNLLVIAGADMPIKLADRTRLANDYGAQAFISIHHDSVHPTYLKSWVFNNEELNYSDHARGYSIFVSSDNPKYSESLSLAVMLGNALHSIGLTPSSHHSEKIKGENRPVVDQHLGIYRFDSLAVLNSTEMPAILLEAGVIKHRDEEVTLSTDTFRISIAKAILSAVQSFCTSEMSAAAMPILGKEPI